MLYSLLSDLMTYECIACFYTFRHFSASNNANTFEYTCVPTSKNLSNNQFQCNDYFHCSWINYIMH